ncbi:MAG TPA: DUF4175 domain-containing protein [Polyangiaceae bacterium]|nr:DUF4175 domain-containing protein [Polyangiaceae bacterium]
MAVVPLSTERLSVAFQTRRRTPARWLSLSLLVSLLIGAGLVARLGTPLTRSAAAALLILAVAQIFLRRARDRRDFADVQRTIRRVLVPVDRALGERALRAAVLAERAAQDPRLGSLELAQLHFQRQLDRAPLAAVETQAARRATWLRWAALGLVLIAGLGVGRDPNRVLEGLDVLLARRGVAPVPMPWLDMVRVTVQPPAYLHLQDRAIFPGLGSAEARGSTVTVRGLPLAAGRQLVLTDGTHEVPFVADGSDGVVARYVLKENADLTIAARFGQVLIREAEGVTLEAVPDAVPVVELEGAPLRIELRDFDRRELRYEARDDHGLREIDLVLRAGGREDRRPLTRLDGTTKLTRGAYAIESSEPFLRRTFLPVEVRIEARDDDATSGVQWGKSQAFTLIPVPVGEPEAARYAALRAVRDSLTDLLASELSPAPGLGEAERRKADSVRTKALAADLRAILEKRFAGIRLPPAQRAFLGGQARVLERALPTPASAMRRTEDVLLAVDSALRGLGNRDAPAVAKRLGDAAEEAAEGAKLALESERRETGLSRLNQALAVLGPGARHLLTLGPLGRDVGSVAEGEIRRITRARDSGNLLATELAARHLAARLRRPSPSFSTAGGGGVESGAGSQSGDESHPSDADKKFDELVGELERLAEEHQQELGRVERHLADAEKAVDLSDLKQEAAQRANELRQKTAPLPQFGDDPNSARAAAALGREHAQSMAQSLARLSLKDAVESGRHARSELEDAAKRRKNSNAFEVLDEAALGEARAELDRALAWAEQSLARAEKSAAEKAQVGLQDSSGRERALSDRAANLAGRGNHGEIALPEDLADALSKAEGLMRDAAKELGAGHGEQGLSLQRDAQRLLEQTNSGQSGSGDSEGKDQQPQPSAKDSSSSKGKQMRTEADVPRAEGGLADDFRRRVLEGLSKEQSGRLSDAVRRYAEGLLQ